MTTHKTLVRDLQILKQVVEDITYRQISQEFDLSPSRVQQIWRTLASKILQQCRSSGTPEDFYPGPDTDRGGDEADNFCYPVRYLSKRARMFRDSINPFYCDHEPTDISIDAHFLGDVDTLRQYKNFWLHQINKRQPRKIK